jgi:small subunit ribosomal protein S18
MSDRAKIRNMRVSGNNRQQQLDIANAIKIAREMALLPYAKRVASASRTRPPRDGERRPRRDEGFEEQTEGVELVDLAGIEEVDDELEVDDVVETDAEEA